MAKPFEFFPVDPATKPEGWKPAKILKEGWHKRALAAERRREHPACLQKRDHGSDVKPLAYADWLIKRDGIDVRARAREAVLAYNADLPIVSSQTWRGKRSTVSTERAKPVCPDTFTMSRVLVWVESDSKQMRPCSVLFMVTGARDLVGFTLELPHWNWEPSCVESTVDDDASEPDSGDGLPLEPDAAPETVATSGDPVAPAPDAAGADAAPAEPAPCQRLAWSAPIVLERMGLCGTACAQDAPVVGIQDPTPREAIGDPREAIKTADPREAIPLTWSPDASSHPVVIHCLSDASFDAMARLILDGTFPAETRRGKAGSFRLTLDDARRCERLKSVRLSGMPRKPYPKRTPRMAIPTHIAAGSFTPVGAIAGRAVTLHAPSF